MVQISLFEAFCPCGGAICKAGLCNSCYARAWHSRRQFGGLREQVIERDGGRCRACGGREWLIVHHRIEKNALEWLITLCAGCHARVHRLKFNDRWLPELLFELWSERREQQPIQLQLRCPPGRLYP